MAIECRIGKDQNIDKGTGHYNESSSGRRIPSDQPRAHGPDPRRRRRVERVPEVGRGNSPQFFDFQCDVCDGTDI